MLLEQSWRSIMMMIVGEQMQQRLHEPQWCSQKWANSITTMLVKMSKINRDNSHKLCKPWWPANSKHSMQLQWTMQIVKANTTEVCRMQEQLQQTLVNCNGKDCTKEGLTAKTLADNFQEKPSRAFDETQQSTCSGCQWQTKHMVAACNVTTFFNKGAFEGKSHHHNQQIKVKILMI